MPSAENDAIHEVHRAMRALYTSVPAEVARDVAARVESALAQAWDDGWIVGNRWAFSDADVDAIEANPHRPIPPGKGSS